MAEELFSSGCAGTGAPAQPPGTAGAPVNLAAQRALALLRCLSASRPAPTIAARLPS